MEGSVFISYSQVDGMFVDSLNNHLLSEQVNVWWDANEQAAGDYIKKQIQKGISPSSVFVVVMSKQSVKSNWVRFELNSALSLNAIKNNIQILLVKIDETPFPSDLPGVHYVDARGSMKNVVSAILKLLRHDPKPTLKFDNWDNFNAKKFEDLVFDILSAEHHLVKRLAPTRDTGVDMVVEGSNQFGVSDRTLVQVKFYRNSKINTAVLREMSAILHFNQGNQILLITNSELTAGSRQFWEKTAPKIMIWEGHQLISKLNAHPEVFHKYFPGAQLLSQPVQLVDKKLEATQAMICELENCPEGMAGWKSYEDICIKIIDHLFVPPLNPPKIQCKRESGIDIRDAIYPNRGLDDNWRFVRDDYDAKYIVVEFKNYSKTGSAIDKQTVLQVDDYLKKKTIGRFGIICSKKLPDFSALEKRRDVFTESGKLILFINNEHLKDMLLRKYNDLDPFDIINDLIDDFNLKF